VYPWFQWAGPGFGKLPRPAQGAAHLAELVLIVAADEQDLLSAKPRPQLEHLVLE
jgi:hypothetical protein